MSREPPDDLSLLTALGRQTLAEQGLARDDIRVLTAIVMRRDATLSALLTEIRATNYQYASLEGRVRTFEANDG